MKIVLPWVLLATAALSASADLNGRWSGTAELKMPDGTRDTSPLYLTVKLSGAEVSGTIGPADDQQWPLMKAKIEGDAISFEVQSNGPLFKVRLTLAEGRLKGEANGEGHQGPVTATLDLARRVE